MATKHYRVSFLRLDSTVQKGFVVEAESAAIAMSLFWADRKRTDSEYREFLQLAAESRGRAGVSRPQCPIEIIRTDRVKKHGSRWHAMFAV